ncbi:MAG TPA: biotin--[acetyl-CoA-carboxylase] ligase [Propionibacteriaceae bacterium]|nr:biotin--[acetyl-CoA-carboxylase] ligase [Propionibacteriaceae bacterium]
MSLLPAPADERAIRAGLSGVPLWTAVRCVRETGSTNADLAAAARAGAASGAVLLGEHQTAGRGRFDRRWETPLGTSIAVSVSLAPRRPVPQWGWLSLLAGVAVRGGILDATGADDARVHLKWPNDVLIDGRKVCGILSEAVETASGWQAIVGMGINIALTEHELPVDNATSLRIAGLPENKDALVVATLTRLADLVSDWEAGRDVRERYVRECASVGRRVRIVESPQSVREGLGLDVDTDGRLVVRLDDGSRRAFAAGDVHHLR